MAEVDLTQEYVRSLFDYNPSTGALTWRECPRENFSSERLWKIHITRWAGKDAGYIDKSNGYRRVDIDGVGYRAHRIAWLHYYGALPNEVDHDNGVRSDNRIANLVDTSRSGNMKNKGMHKNNRSGVTGVSWAPKDKKWVARITVNYNNRRIGGFDNKDDAIAARLKAEKELGFHEHHGRRKAHAL